MPNPINQPNFTGPKKGGGALVFREKVKLHDSKGTMKRLTTYLFHQKGLFAAAFACALLSTIITIAGTRMNGYVIDTYIALEDLRGLLIICVILIGMYLMLAMMTYLQNILMIRAAQAISAAIRHDLFQHIQRLPLFFYDTRSSGDIMSRLTNDVDNINTALSQGVVQLFTSVITIAGMLGAMLLLSPMLTLVSLITIPLTYLVSKTIARLAQRYYIAQQTYLGRLNGYIEEMVSGQKLVKLFCQEERVNGVFQDINEKLIRNALWAKCLSALMGPCNHMINNFAYLAVAVIGGISVLDGNGTMSVGIIFSFLLFMKNFTNPINNILNLVNTLQLALASAERVFEILDQSVEQDDPLAEDIQVIHGDVRMEHIHFSYLPGKEILKDALICASSGQTIAIVGPTGAGKTTIINLLTKFYEINRGQILIDGRDLHQITRSSLRHCIAMVLQDTFLFSDTIRENIRYGRINASDADIEAAAKQAYAHEFIMQLPHGYDTILCDNGKNLSQGQRQLISIARALLSNASILILDEATSCVDTRTEILIQNALLKLMEGKTSFVIAHRLSTIRSADQILVLQDGHVVEQGTHDELIAKQGFYEQLYDRQFKAGKAL